MADGPWRSSSTARDLTGDDLKSVNDIFDPKFKGKVTMLTEMRDTVGLGPARRRASNPRRTANDQALAAIEKIEKADRDGQIRRFTGNDYTRGPAEGRLDRDPRLVGRRRSQLQADNPNVEFLQPEEGFMIWSPTTCRSPWARRTRSRRRSS